MISTLAKFFIAVLIAGLLIAASRGWRDFAYT
jgi:hypothetical protein